MKTTKEDRDKMRDFYGDIRLQRADCRVIMALDDLEAAEAEVQRLREVMRELLVTGIALEALLADEPSSVYIHPEIWAKLKEHRGHLRRGLLMLTQESESITVSKEEYEWFVAQCNKPGEEPSEKLKKLVEDYRRTVTSLPDKESESGK